MNLNDPVLGGADAARDRAPSFAPSDRLARVAQGLGDAIEREALRVLAAQEREQRRFFPQAPCCRMQVEHGSAAVLFAGSTWTEDDTLCTQAEIDGAPIDQAQLRLCDNGRGGACSYTSWVGNVAYTVTAYELVDRVVLRQYGAGSERQFLIGGDLCKLHYDGPSREAK